MARFCDLVGHEVVKEMLRGNLARDFFVPPLVPVFSVLVQTAVTLAGADPDDDAAAFATLERLFAPPGTSVPPFEPLDFFSLPFDDDPAAFTQNEAQLAQWIARLLGPVGRSAMATGTVDRATHAETPAPRQPVPETFEAGTRVLAINDDTRTAVDGMRDDGVFDSAQGAAASATAAAAVVAPGQFINFVRALAGYIARLCPRAASLPSQIVSEVTTTGMKAAVAEAMAQAAARIPLQLTSTMSIGNHVHRTLQRRYEDRRGPVADVVSERWNPIINRPDQTVIGPTTGGAPLPLGDVARSAPMDTDHFFKCLHTALASPRLDRETWLRADLVDRDRLEIWEIKPVASAQSGVWQEAIYRNSFNLVRALLECMHLGPLTGPLSPGGSLVMPSSGRAGIRTGTASVLNPIDVSSRAGQPAVAIPFQVILLQGLVPYIVLRSPSQGELTAVLMAMILRAWQEAARQARRAARQLATAAARALQHAADAVSEWATPENIVLAVVAIVVIILIALAIYFSGGLALGGAGAGGAGAGAGGAAGAGAGAGLGTTIAEAFAAFIAVVRGLIAPAAQLAPAAAGGVLLNVTSPSAPTRTPAGDGTLGSTQVTTLNLQGLTVQGVPVAAIGPLLEGLGRSLDPALAQVASRLRGRPTAPSAVA